MLKKLKSLQPEEPAPKCQKNEAEDIGVKLHKLKDMVQKGLITDHDYEDAKAALLKKFID
jgi:hypothetical protein